MVCEKRLVSGRFWRHAQGSESHTAWDLVKSIICIEVCNASV